MRTSTSAGRNPLRTNRTQAASDRQKLARLGIGFAFVIALVAFFLHWQNQTQQVRNGWPSTSASIEDVQTAPASLTDSARSGGMLYTIRILAKYELDGQTQTRWIDLDRRPEPLTDAESEASQWKGRQCVVHWNPADPNQVFAEIS